MSKVRLATAWLDGCSGCHMSLLDMDERLIELSSAFDLVYSPLVDIKTFPEAVDITLVEGAVSSTDDVEKIYLIRARTRLLVVMGDCAVTGNVPTMRNAFGPDAVLRRAYFENADLQQQTPFVVVPKLLDTVRPVHEYVNVDLYLPGCPPSAATFHAVLTELLADRMPDVASLTRFGA